MITAACITKLDVPVGFAPNPLALRWSKHCWHCSPGTSSIAFRRWVSCRFWLCRWPTVLPAEVKVNNEVPLWAARELENWQTVAQ